MGNRVDKVQTNVSESQMAQAILEAWNDLFHQSATQEQVAIILAQNALETGHRKSMWNYNVGNIKANPKGVHNYFHLYASEQLSPGKWKKMTMPFRAYSTLKDGVSDYLSLLSKSKRYSNAWQHILHPDPAAFSKALKDGGYYTADESKYTKLMTSLYSKFNKSDSYQKAKSGEVTSPQLLADSPKNNDWMQDYMKTHQDKNIWEQLGLVPSKTNDSVQNVPVQNNLSDSVMNDFLQQVQSSEKQNKNLYKKFLPNNNIVIKIQASEFTEAIEFSRILCAALDEELMAKAFIYTNRDQVEIDCSIYGPKEICFNAVKQLSGSLELAFKKATIKIGGLNIKTTCIMDKKSSYQPIDFKLANTQHRKFLLKFF